MLNCLQKKLTSFFPQEIFFEDTPIFDVKKAVRIKNYVVSTLFFVKYIAEIKGEADLVKQDTRCATCEMRNDGKELVT